MFSGAFCGRRVLVTGHTGFKGSWLSEWLVGLGAQVTGVSLEPETDPSLFRLLDLEHRIASHRIVDIRNAAALSHAFAEAQPEVVLHLAAQALVRRSYAEPTVTWDTNVGGTLHVLEAIRQTASVRACVVVTSDKCYENREWIWGYRECDPLGGHDPYSASKAAAELLVTSHRRSFFSPAQGSACRLASARAGNVVGGGDWSQDRVIVDFVRAITMGRPLVLRHPNATRPWQHVLEPLSGYLHLAAKLLQDDGERWAEAWNFGPSETNVATVADLAGRMIAAWGHGSVAPAHERDARHEAGLLKLDCTKSAIQLGWRGAWNLDETVQRTVDWYRSHLLSDNIRSLTTEQIIGYGAAARAVGLPWT